MLKIHKLHSKHKLLLTSITSICITFGLLGFYCLTYTPELSHAETISVPDQRVLTDIKYMQQMNSYICDNSYEGDTKQLIDFRDSKSYWVTKLKDQNCWMTQNLDLDLNSDKALTSVGSDVTVSWIPENSTQPLTSPWGRDKDVVRSYDPGEYIYTLGLESDLCENSASIADCSGHGWQLAPHLSIDLTGDEQSHYLVGNYYSYTAMAAGGASNNSICPKGWRVPSISQFQALVRGLNSSTTEVADNIKAVPYYFIYGGIATESTLAHGSYTGYYWSIDAGKEYSRYLSFADNAINTTNATSRFQGFSVRCVARDEIFSNNIKIEVNPTISLDVASETEVEEGVLSESGLDVNVVSNQPYSISISSDYPDLTSPSSEVVVPAKGGAALLAGEDTEGGWGIKKKISSDGNGCIDSARSFTAVTVLPQVFCSTGVPGNSKITFPIGVRLPLNIPAGEYSTDITVTATQN